MADGGACRRVDQQRDLSESPGATGRRRSLSQIELQNDDFDWLFDCHILFFLTCKVNIPTLVQIRTLRLQRLNTDISRLM